MHIPVYQPDETAVVEVKTRVPSCIIRGCDGQIVRHSLGAGQSVLRCTRCFRRYQVQADLVTRADSRLRHFFNDFASWRDD